MNQPLSLGRFGSPFVAAVLLSPRDTERELAQFIYKLEASGKRGVVRAVPLSDVRAYDEGLRLALLDLDDAACVDPERVIIEYGTWLRRDRRAFRLLEFLPN